MAFAYQNLACLDDLSPALRSRLELGLKLQLHAERGRERTLSQQHIIDIVSDHFNLNPEEILGDKRQKNVVLHAK